MFARSLYTVANRGPIVFQRGLTNYYKLFPKSLPKGPPPNGPFEIDTRALRSEYLKCQQQAHPDVASHIAPGNAPQVDSAELGSAYRTLCDPLLRAEHILALHGIASLSEGVTLQDEDMLMDIMMVREQVAESMDDPEARAKLSVENQERLDNIVAAASEAFAKNDLEAAHKATIVMSYWAKIQRELNSAS